MIHYLNTYAPLVASKSGRIASHARGIPPFVDGSIRREPDLEHPWPSISCLCRANKFAPRLCVGDVVGYMTRKARYGALLAPHRRLTAVLEVVAVLQSHEEAACWYHQRKLALPNNCMVQGNPPKSLEESHRIHKTPRLLDDDRLARRWNAQYQRRATKYPRFVVCQPLFRDLSWDAPVVEDRHLIAAFGRVPGTRNPGAVPQEGFERLLEIVKGE